MTSPHRNEPGRAWIQKNTLAGVIVGLGVLALIVVGLGILLEDRLETLEGRLVTQPSKSVEMTPVDLEARRPTRGAVLYVPVYSHIYEDGGTELLLEATLSIRNTDPKHAIIIESVDYYDSTGKLVRIALEAPSRLEPLASTEFLVDRKDRTGGAGANFLVSWAADENVSEPLIEAIMVGASGNRGMAFARPGRVVAERGGRD